MQARKIRMHFECRRNLKIAARMRLERLECTSNAVGIFRLLLECGSNDWNVLRMPSISLDCCSNAARMRLEWLECTSNAVWIFRLPLQCSSNDIKRVQLECTSNAVGIFRLLLECSSNDWNALRMPSESLDCYSNAARTIIMHFECRRNL